VNESGAGRQKRFSVEFELFAPVAVVGEDGLVFLVEQVVTKDALQNLTNVRFYVSTAPVRVDNEYLAEPK